MHRTGEIERRVVRCVSVNAHCATNGHSYLLLPTAAWDAHPAALPDSPRLWCGRACSRCRMHGRFGVRDAKGEVRRYACLRILCILEIPQRLSGWKYMRVRTAGDGHGMWAEWGWGLRVTSCTVFAVCKAAGRCLLGAAVLDRGRDVLNPRALGMVHGHRSWAAMVSRRIMHCVYASRSSRRHTPCVVCLCVSDVSQEGWYGLRRKAVESSSQSRSGSELHWY